MWPTKEGLNGSQRKLGAVHALSPLRPRLPIPLFSRRARRFGTPTAPIPHTVYALSDFTRRLLGDDPRAPSPTGVGDDSVDGIELDPELAVIARTTKIDVQRKASSTPVVGAGGSRSPSPVRGGGPEEVTIRVRWQNHPLNPEQKRVVYEYNMKRVCKLPTSSYLLSHILS